MAEIFQAPTWLNLRGDTPAESYARGFALGEARRRSQQEAFMEQQRIAQQQQAQEQRAAIAQAELAAEIKKQQEYAATAQEELAIKKQAQAQKDRQAAMQTAGIVALQRDAMTMPIEQAISRNFAAFAHDPGAMAGALHAIRTLSPPPAFQPSTTTVQHPITGEDIPVFQGGRGSAQMIREPVTKPVAPSRAESAELDILKREIMGKKATLEKDQFSLSMMTPDSDSHKKMKADVDRQQAEIDKLMGQLRGTGKVPAKAAAGESKATQRLKLARQLMSDHPDWSKEQVIAEARKQIP